MTNNDLENLLKTCTKLVNKTDLDISKKNLIKQNVLRAVKIKKSVFEEIFIDNCKKVFSLVNIDRLEMAEIKEYVFENLPIRRKWYSFHFPLFQKKVWSFAILLVFVVSIFGKFSLTTAPEVYAKEPVLYISAGNVEIRRGGLSFKAENELAIHEGDVIKTFDNTVSYIAYPDGNNSNFGQNSSIFFQKLTFDPKNLTNSEVSIKLNEGRLLNIVYNSILSNSKFEVIANNVDVNAVNSVFDVAINQPQEDKEVNVSVVNSFVDIDIKKDNYVENKTVFKEEQIQIASNGDYKILDLNDAVKKDPWLASNIKSQKEHILADNSVTDEVSNLIAPLQDAVESILTDDNKQSVNLQISDIKALFEKASYNKKKGNFGLAQQYLDQIEIKMKYIFDHYSNIKDISELGTKMDNRIAYYEKHKTTLIPAKAYDDYLNNFNELELLIIRDELADKKIKIDESLEELISSLNKYDNSLIQSNTEDYIQNLKSTFDFVSKINNKEKREQFYSEYSEKTLNIFKSITAKFSSSDNKDDLRFAFKLQKQISELFENYKFLDDKILDAYNEMQNAFINIDIEDTQEDYQDKSDNEQIPQQTDSNDGSTDATVEN